MYNFVLVLATDSRCHLAAARNAIRLHHHHQQSVIHIFLNETILPFVKGCYTFLLVLVTFCAFLIGTSSIGLPASRWLKKLQYDLKPLYPPYRPSYFRECVNALDVLLVGKAAEW